jgi:hypothetical protein
MGGGKRVALAVSVALMCLPGTASATTAQLGNPNLLPEAGHHFGCPPCELGAYTLAQIFSPGVDFAPAAGRITSWRVTGSAAGKGTLKLRVLEGGPEGGWIGTGTSAPATNFRGLEGPPNATSLPIDLGDAIGVDLTMTSTVGDGMTEGEAQLWTPPIVDGEERNTAEPDIFAGSRVMLSAEEVLTPVVTLLSPASGSASGGNAVNIAGLYLDSATGVTFGSTPASSFSIDSSNEITAIAPASAASTVDVRVTGPGGSSQPGAGDRYTFTAPATTTLVPLLGPSLALAKPTVSGFGQSASRWRRGRSLPRISSAGAPPRGTTFGFSLSEPATASFAFTQRVPGRRVGGRCVVVGQRNAGKPKCKRTVGVGSFSLAGHAGLNKVHFQGRLSSAKTLKPGAYGVAISARDSHGLRSAPQSLSFTIVPG